jgi:2'-5' RNA ligase
MSYNNVRLDGRGTSFGDVLSQISPLASPKNKISLEQSQKQSVLTNCLTEKITLVTKKLLQLNFSEEDQVSPPQSFSQVSGNNLASSQKSLIKREHSAYQSPKNIQCVNATVEKEEEFFEAIVKVPFQLNGLPREMVPQTAPRKKNGHLMSEELEFPLLRFKKVPSSLEKVFVERMKTIDLDMESTTLTPTLTTLNGRSVLTWKSENSLSFDAARCRVFPIAAQTLHLGQDAELERIPMQTFLYSLVQTGRLPTNLPPSVQQLPSVTMTIQGSASPYFFHKKAVTIKTKSPVQPLAPVVVPVPVTPVSKKDQLMSVDVSLSLSSMSAEQSVFFETLRESCIRYKNIEVTKLKDLHISLCIVEGVAKDVARRIERTVQGVLGDASVRATAVPTDSLSIIGRSKNFAVVKMEGDNALMELSQRVRDIVFQISGLKDHFPFAPHVSVARSKAPEGFPHDFVGKIPLCPPEFVFRQEHLVVSMRPVTMSRLVRRGNQAAIPQPSSRGVGVVL